MKKIILSLAYVISMTGLFIGCSDSNSSSGSTALTSSQLFPLKVGNTWTYHNREWNDDGSVNEDNQKQIVVLRDTNYEGHPAFFVNAFDKAGIYYYNGNDLYNESYRFLYALNKVGEEIVTQDTSATANRRYVNVFRANNLTVTVPAGTFTCLQFDEVHLDKNTSGGLDSSGIDSYFYAPNKGIIKETLVVFPQGNRHTFRIVELTNCDLK